MKRIEGARCQGNQDQEFQNIDNDLTWTSVSRLDRHNVLGDSTSTNSSVHMWRGMHLEASWQPGAHRRGLLDGDKVAADLYDMEKESR